MIITRTPYRISFFGGGTDYPAWYRENMGRVIGTTIDKYCYITARWLPPFFKHKHRIVYSIGENVNEIDQIQHPSVREVMRYLNITQGVSIHHDGDLPARSGMGSSSAFTVGLLNALHALRGMNRSPGTLADQAILVEQTRIRESVGSQDQVFAAYGGLNQINFFSHGPEVERLILSEPGVFESKWMLFFTGLTRVASHVAQDQISRMDQNRWNLGYLLALVDEARRLLEMAQYPSFGRLLDEAWKLKKTLSSKISNPFIDQAYEAALKAGALGGKLLGAGGGGFLLFYVEPEHQEAVKAALAPLLHVPFRFESLGSQVIS